MTAPGSPKRRETYQLTNTAPRQTLHLSWQPATLSVQNTSKFAVYISYGANSPSSKAFDEIIAPFSSFVGDPVGNQDFSFFVDNTSDPSSVFPFPITIIVSTGAASVQSALSAALSTAPSSAAYISKVLGIQAASLIDFWVCDDTGTTTLLDRVSQLRNGIWDNLPSQQSALGPDNVTKVETLNGTNQDGNLLTASLAAVLNGPAGTLACWVQMPTAKWNDANTYGILDLFVDAVTPNRITIRKVSGPAVNFQYCASTALSYAVTPSSGWFHLAFTWNKALNRQRYYLNGVKNVTENTIVAALAGSLAQAWLGRWSVGNQLPGSIAFACLWTTELAQSDITSLATAP